MNFYKHDDCDNILLEMGEPGTPLGDAKLTLLEPNTVDAAVEKHVPVVSVQDGKVLVKIGEVPHPMVPEHYIEWVYVKTSFGGVFCALNPGDAPEASLKLVPDEVEEVYIYCNLHGLWKAKEPVLPLEFDVNTVACSPEFAAGCVNPSQGAPAGVDRLP